MNKAVISVVLALGLGMTQARAQGVSDSIKSDAGTSNFIASYANGANSGFGFGISIGGYNNSTMEVKVSGSEVSVSGLGTAQTNERNILGGIKVDANMSNFILTDMDGMKSKLGFGVTVGGYTKFEFTENFALQPEILLHFKNSKMEVEASGDETDFQYFGMEIPVYAVGQMNIGSGKGFIGAGPYVGLGFDARYKADGMDDLKLYKEYDGQKSNMQRWDFGAGAMLGYEFGNRLQIVASYKIGFVDALNANKDNASMLNQTVSLGLGFRF
ncbi:MAG: PorT family protein [Tannerella sp.]|jgi:hypothetical protein|nr:PorT family protein [Tannerella sp.]